MSHTNIKSISLFIQKRKSAPLRSHFGFCPSVDMNATSYGLTKQTKTRAIPVAISQCRKKSFFSGLIGMQHPPDSGKWKWRVWTVELGVFGSLEELGVLGWD
eukprot:gnl/MRDRNA2_/MRDRNA2_568044_c0_seq1.p2 gnl/MRDRNA2_/MRDRNA2_568044_c0~~gnl/MRDRNA2_/MRDRNA2_568044_c0_seq1.p2  ORF type:complete len:111 (-),score=14.18 gnl/MRDRNA2_/MRDRNA2_568044_c0_seq1:33-338(-)